MAAAEKSATGLKNVINLPKKEGELKKSEIDIKEAEKAVQHLHSTQGKVTRLSIDVPETWFVPIKNKQYKKGFKTTRDYVLSLIEKDLAEN